MTISSYGHRFDLVGLVGTGVLSYNHPVTSIDGEAGGKNYPTSIGSLSHYVDIVHPETSNTIQGFLWDERILADESEENWDAFIPVNYDPTTSGVDDYFQSGIGDSTDLEFIEAEAVAASGVYNSLMFDVWAPVINHGYYYDFLDEGYLYSDDSELLYPTLSGVVPGVYWTGIEPDDAVASGFNLATMESFPKPGVPITAVQMQWLESEGKYEIWKNWRKVIDFTGIRDSDLQEQSTRNPITNDIYWHLPDRDKNEFLVSFSGVTNVSGTPEIIFNQQVVEPIGLTYSGLHFSELEIVGISTGKDNQEFHLKYSPVDSSKAPQIYSFVTKPDGYVSEASVCSGFLGGGLIGGGPLYDGILETGELDVEVKEWLPAPVGTTFSGYQCNIDYDLGTLAFGNSTLPGIQTPSAGEYVAAGYWRTARIEYEPVDTTNTLLAVEANLNPIYRHSGQGFVYLSTRTEDPVSVVLSADLAEISSDIYGPLNIGNNYAPIVALVKDARGNALENQAVTFQITSYPAVGGFGGTNLSIVAVTDEEGKATAYYNPPRTILDIGEEITYDGYSVNAAPAYPGVTETTTFRTDKLLIRGDESDIFLFQNRVDDPILGWRETSIDQDDLDAQLTEYYRTYLLEHEIYGATGLDGSGVPNNYLTNQTWEDLHRTLLDMARPSMFSQNQGMGRKVLVAAPDPDALNPHTLTAGAWAPMQPIDIVEISAGVYDIVYDTSTYSIPVPSGTMGPTTSGSLYSYFVVAPTQVEMQAQVYNERLQQAIISNTIDVQLSIPEYLNGLWMLDEINQIEIDEVNVLLSGVIADPSKKIPLGFRLKSSNVALASALDGVTFLDVNPRYNANIWDVDEVTSLGHSFNITSIA